MSKNNIGDLTKEKMALDKPAGEPLPKHIHDESNGLDYTLVDGSSYLPDLAPAEDEKYRPGIWAQRRLRYLKRHRRVLYSELLTTGKLNAHLRETDERAEAMFELLAAQTGEREGLIEQLKRDDQMAWVQLANSIRHRAEEVVNTEVIYA
jgi:hypothetical protein